MKKALVTGAAGFIGSHVVRALLDDNVHVRAMIRPGEDTRNIKELDIEIVEGDVMDNDFVKKAVSGVDTVFHLAAIYAIWMPDWRPIYEVNLQGSRNILWACLHSGVGKVVYTSSISAIGIAPGKDLSNETTPFNQYDLGSHYVITKYLSQQEALGFAANGLDLVVVNPAFPFGPGDIGPTPTGRMIIDIATGINRTAFSGGLNIVDVRDVAMGHVLAAKKGKSGELYILGNRNVTVTELMDMVNNCLGQKKRYIPMVPKAVLTGGTYVLRAWSDRVSHKPPMSTPVEIRYASNYLYFDNTKAKTQLGLDFRPVETSIKESLEWFRENGRLQG